MEKGLTVKQLINEFEFEVLTGSEDALNRYVTVADISRPGFELAGYYKYSDLRRLIIFGHKEMAFIEQLDPESLVERLKFLMSSSTPAILITRGQECPEEILELARKLDFPILLSRAATGIVSIELTSYLDESLAKEAVMHAVLLNLYGKGVLIKGESGIGKSEIALELIRRGHILIADDCVEIFRLRHSILGKAPSVLRNMLEIRGVGIIDVAKMFGVSSVLEKNTIDIIIELERLMPTRSYTRSNYGADYDNDNIFGVDIPKISIPVMGGRNMAVIIEAAVTNLRLKEYGYDSSKEFMERVKESIKINSLRNDDIEDKE